MVASEGCRELSVQGCATCLPRSAQWTSPVSTTLAVQASVGQAVEICIRLAIFALSELWILYDLCGESFLRSINTKHWLWLVTKMDDAYANQPVARDSIYVGYGAHADS